MKCSDFSPFQITASPEWVSRYTRLSQACMKGGAKVSCGTLNARHKNKLTPAFPSRFESMESFSGRWFSLRKAARIGECVPSVYAAFTFASKSSEAMAPQGRAAISLFVSPPSRCNTGVVATVVTIAIITNIAKSIGFNAPRSMATFKTISSMRPRVFIKMPRETACLQGRPVSHAATLLPPNFPSDAIRMITPQIIHSFAPVNRPICVRIPVNAKNAGSSKTITRSLIFGGDVPSKG